MTVFLDTVTGVDMEVRFFESAAADAPKLDIDYDATYTEVVQLGIARNYPLDASITNNPNVLAATTCDVAAWQLADFGYAGATANRGYRTTNIDEMYTNDGTIEYQNTIGSHNPQTYDFEFADFPSGCGEQDRTFLRFYRKYQWGYDYTCQSKACGVYARNPPGGGGSGRPNGTDRFSLKWQAHSAAGGLWEPRPYFYHPEQPLLTGESRPCNIGSLQILQPDRWYCFESMLQANTPTEYDGEIKMWIDGILRCHFVGIRFRDISGLQINQLNVTAYMGGVCTSPANQYLWDDNLVLATKYVGPMISGREVYAR